MPQTGKSILIIDDNEDMLVMVSILLRKKGYFVTAREKFASLEAEITALSPDLILIDRKLGWTDGCELCRLIRTFPGCADIIILIFSAYSITSEECAEVGANGFFEKPFGMANFLQSIEGYLQV